MADWSVSRRLAWLLLLITVLSLVEPLAGTALLDEVAASGGQQRGTVNMDMLCFTKGQVADLTYIGAEQEMYNDTQVCRPKRANGTDSAGDLPIACFAIWTEEETDEGRKVHVKSQGCYFGSAGDPRSCASDKCVDTVGTKINNTYYCCCSSRLCNGEGNLTRTVTAAQQVSSTSLRPDDSAADALSSANDVRILLAVGGTLIGCCVLVLVLYFIYRKKALQYAPKRLLMAAAEAASGASRASSGPASRLLSPVSATGGGPDAPSYSVLMGGGLKMDTLLHRGKFGEVWRAVLDGHGSVCVKVFNASQSQHALFLNEREIYSLPLMQHEAVVRCLAAEERRAGGGGTLSAQYVIVMEYHPLGSLNSYLKGAKGGLTYQVLCSMCHSIAAGLGHLHLEILGSTLGGPSGGPHKPAIVHRDLNSRNILVKNDLTCAIADMGFALKIKGSKYCRTDEENIEEASLRDVGTVRYMAPEILDGAVNLRECESSLKQIDVYALGLVLWEVATQCCDLYQGNRTTLPYRIPYEDEVGLNPTFEEMQMLVSKNRHRPAFPTTWKDTPIVQSIKETIQDCWDYDAEARLTALCVQERFKEFSSVTEVRNRPTSVIALNQNVDGKPRSASSCGLIGNVRGDAATDRDDVESSPLLGSHLMQGGTALAAAHSVTAESNAKMDVNVELDQTRRQQQTIAGRNALISRNTMQPHMDDVLDVVGNTLVKRASPHPGMHPAQPSAVPPNSRACVTGASGDHSSNVAAAAALPPRHTGSFCGGGAAAAGAHVVVPPPAAVQSMRSAVDAGAANGLHRRSPSDAATSARQSCTGLQKKVPNCTSECSGSSCAAAAGLDLVPNSSQSPQPMLAAAASGSDAASVGGLRTQSRSARPDSLPLRVRTK